MSTTAYAWAPITKTEKQNDGTLMVYGPVSDAGLDRDKQRLNQDWLDKSLPAWMAEGGNVREMHKAVAAGVAAGLTRREDGTHDLVAHVVDPVAVLKVEKRVLKGFSVGIREPQISFGKADAPMGEVVGGTIVEVSLVDRPANPRCLFTMVKADGAGELEDVEDPEVEDVEEDPEADEEAEETLKVEIAGLNGHALREELVKFVSAASRRRMADSGTAMPNGDFPIPDEGHLRSAVGHLGNYTGDRTAAKAHIVARARALGLENLLPDDWGIAKAEQLLASVTALGLPDLTKADDEATDIATAKQACALIAKLIASEAMSMANGTHDESGDIACLLDAKRALDYFIACEEQEMEPDTADAMKVEDTPDLVKTDTADGAASLAAAVAEAVKPLQDQLDLVKAEMAKVAATPVPGGPVAMRTASQTQAARGSDAATMRARAAEFIAKADSTDDPTLRAGYRAEAADLLTKAAA